MVSKEDWNAAMSSEVFRGYLDGELTKEAAKNRVVEDDSILSEFDQFEQRVQSDAKLRVAFRELQKKMAADTAYRNSMDPKFADGVMMLDLGDD